MIPTLYRALLVFEAAEELPYMETQDANICRSHYISPLQLLISLTVAIVIISGLIIAGATDMSAGVAILLGATALTLGRIIKRLYTTCIIYEQGTLSFKTGELAIGRSAVVKVFDIYLSRVILSSFFYGIGITWQFLLTLVN